MNYENKALLSSQLHRILGNGVETTYWTSIFGEQNNDSTRTSFTHAFTHVYPMKNQTSPQRHQHLLENDPYSSQSIPSVIFRSKNQELN